MKKSTTSKASKWTNTFDHPIAATIHEYATKGHTFGDIMDKYNLSDAQKAKIHQYRSSMEHDLRRGKPVADVVHAHFGPQIASKILVEINKYKAQNY